jgi:hypothetical protein
VVLRIAEDGIWVIDQRRNNSGIRGEARWKHERRFSAFELSEPPFQLCMHFASATDERAGTAAPPVALDRSPRGGTKTIIGC